MNEESKAHVLELGSRWADAESRGDIDSLGALLADDFVLVGPLGFMLDKQQYLGSRRSGDLKHEAFAWNDVRVRLFGEAALAEAQRSQDVIGGDALVLGQVRDRARDAQDALASPRAEGSHRVCVGERTLGTVLEPHRPADQPRVHLAVTPRVRALQPCQLAASRFRYSGTRACR